MYGCVRYWLANMNKPLLATIVVAALGILSCGKPELGSQYYGSYLTTGSSSNGSLTLSVSDTLVSVANQKQGMVNITLPSLTAIPGSATSDTDITITGQKSTLGLGDGGTLEVQVNGAGAFTDSPRRLDLTVSVSLPNGSTVTHLAGYRQ